MGWTSRNMAVLASVQDRVEVWNRSVKMPEVEEDDMGKSSKIKPNNSPNRRNKY